MRTKLIILDTPIIVSNEEIRDEDTVTNGVEIFKRSSMSEYSDEYADRYWQKIIAGLEGLPSIDWNGLEEEFGWVDIKYICEGIVDSETSADIDSSYRKTLEKYTMLGFKKAQSLNEKKFSLEDMFKCFQAGIDYEKEGGILQPDAHGYIQSLQQPKVFDIEIETEEYDHDEDWSEISGAFEICKYRPKIINNSIKILRKL